MHLTNRRFFQLALGLLATTVPAFRTPVVCGIPTPEPSYVWVVGAGAGAILVLRRIRAKK